MMTTTADISISLMAYLKRRGLTFKAGPYVTEGSGGRGANHRYGIYNTGPHIRALAVTTDGHRVRLWYSENRWRKA